MCLLYSLSFWLFAALASSAPYALADAVPDRSRSHLARVGAISFWALELTYIPM
jgi:hypothetical protein